MQKKKFTPTTAVPAESETVTKKKRQKKGNREKDIRALRNSIEYKSRRTSKESLPHVVIDNTMINTPLNIRAHTDTLIPEISAYND